MHYFLIHAFESGGAKKGAYVSCWIHFRLYEGALLLAKYYLRQEGWKVRSVDQHRWFNGVSAVPPVGRMYFREAKSKGASIVFHTYDKRRAKSAKGQIET